MSLDKTIFVLDEQPRKSMKGMDGGRGLQNQLSCHK
jgi:hypothetical protein